MHGGDLAEAGRLFPDARQPWIDLSTGLNPEPYPIPDLPAACFARLPSPTDLSAFEQAAADRYGVPADALVAAAGTQPLLAALPRLFPDRGAAIFGPTYSEHRRIWENAGAAVRYIGAAEDIADERVVVVVRPDNPTGRIVPLAELVALQALMARRRGLLVIDEAFADLMPRDETALALPDPSRTLVLRSFGKTYGLAGLRLSFGMGERPLISRLRVELGPWPISGPAIAIGAVALGDEGWLDHARLRLKRRADWLRGLLVSARITIRGETPFFMLVEDPDGALFVHLGRAGIFARRFDDRPAVVRIGMPPGDAETLGRIDAALSSFSP